VILVSGTAGSIGSEVLHQLTRFAIKRLVFIDQAETPMFQLENKLRAKFDNLIIQTLLADITNQEKMERIFQEFHPEIIFHAAAY
jgi:FlaA1/EpsC-like NDP-sugar epimerase